MSEVEWIKNKILGLTSSYKTTEVGSLLDALLEAQAYELAERIRCADLDDSVYLAALIEPEKE